MNHSWGSRGMPVVIEACMYHQRGFGQGVSFVWKWECPRHVCQREMYQGFTDPLEGNQWPLVDWKQFVPKFPNQRFSNQDEEWRGEENLDLNSSCTDTWIFLMEFVQLKWKNSTHILNICHIIQNPIIYSVYCQNCTLGVRELRIGAWGPLNKHKISRHDLSNSIRNHRASSS